MTYMSLESQKAQLYALQDAVMARLQAMGNAQMASAKLCGGTALARFWLDHRLSFDLDFFLPEGFRARDLGVALSAAGIAFETQDLVDDPRRANQLHGYLRHEGQGLKVSFIEDGYFSLFPAILKPLGALAVNTECIEGLYHRKLRTVCGHATAGDVSFDGGRQTARDVFDLYVLSQAVMPLRPFMASLPYAFPSAAFDNGLANMPWFDLMEELSQILSHAKWAQAKDMSFLQDALYAQIGAGIAPDESAQDRGQQR